MNLKSCQANVISFKEATFGVHPVSVTFTRIDYYSRWCVVSPTSL